MNEMEKRLKELSTPEVRIDAFRQKLRRSLLDPPQVSPRGFVSYKIAFAGIGSLCLLLMGMVALFVADPSYAMVIHETIAPQESPASPLENMGGVLRPLPVQKVIPTVAGAGNNRGNPWQQSFETDQRLVEHWAGESLARKEENAEAIEELERFTVSRFKLNSGKTVQVLTRLPQQSQGAAVRRASY